MATNQETGHAKNVATFESLISAINGYGAGYNPSKQSITVSSMTALAQNASNYLSHVNNASGNNSIAIAGRTVVFKTLSSMSTRILNALRASDTTKQIDNAAQALVRKIQGQRATPKLSAEEKAALAAEGTVKKEVSSSQMSFDNRIENFDKLIQLLTGIPQYAPNEIELQLSSLTAYCNSLRAANSAALAADTQLSNARLSRNEVLYKENTGLVDIATAAKMYLKSLFGATSPQYKQVSGLAFKSLPL